MSFELKTEADWVKINGLNMLDVDLTGYSLEDLPKAKAFKKSKMDFYSKVYGYLSFMIQNAPKKKRKGDVKAEQQQKRQRGDRPYDKLLFGDDVEAREAAMEKALWNEDKMEVTMTQDVFCERGGCWAFWNKFYEKQEAQQQKKHTTAMLWTCVIIVLLGLLLVVLLQK